MTGILDNSGITTITDSSFSNNRNDGHGGVIVNRGQLTIQNTDFTNNASEGNGGAIDNAGDLTLIADNDDMTLTAIPTPPAATTFTCGRERGLTSTSPTKAR